MSASDLMAGYTRYTTVDAIGAAAAGDAPATLLSILVSVTESSAVCGGLLSAGADTVVHHC